MDYRLTKFEQANRYEHVMSELTDEQYWDMVAAKVTRVLACSISTDKSLYDEPFKHKLATSIEDVLSKYYEYDHSHKISVEMESSGRVKVSGFDLFSLGHYRRRYGKVMVDAPIEPRYGVREDAEKS